MPIQKAGVFAKRGRTAAAARESGSGFRPARRGRIDGFPGRSVHRHGPESCTPGVVAPAVCRGAAVEHASEGEELRGHLAQLGQESCPRHGVVSAATVQRNPTHITTRRQSLVRSITSKNLQSAWETIPKSTLTTCTAERKKKRERERETCSVHEQSETEMLPKTIC